MGNDKRICQLVAKTLDTVTKPELEVFTAILPISILQTGVTARP